MTSYVLTVDAPLSARVLNNIMIGTCGAVFGIIMISTDNDKIESSLAKKILVGSVALAFFADLFSTNSGTVTISPELK